MNRTVLVKVKWLCSVYKHFRYQNPIPGKPNWLFVPDEEADLLIDVLESNVYYVENIPWGRTIQQQPSSP